LTSERKFFGILLLTFKSSIPRIFPFSSKSKIVLSSIFLFDAKSPLENSMYTASASLSKVISIIFLGEEVY